MLSAGGGKLDVATPFVLCEAGARRLVGFAGVVAVDVAADSLILDTVDGESGNDAGRRPTVDNLALEADVGVWNVDARVLIGFGY